MWSECNWFCATKTIYHTIVQTKVINCRTFIKSSFLIIFEQLVIEFKWLCEIRKTAKNVCIQTKCNLICVIVTSWRTLQSKILHHGKNILKKESFRQNVYNKSFKKGRWVIIVQEFWGLDAHYFMWKSRLNYLWWERSRLFLWE